MFFETSQKWEKLNKRLEEYDKLFGEQERKEQQELKEWSKKFRQKNWIVGGTSIIPQPLNYKTLSLVRAVTSRKIRTALSDNLRAGAL